MSRVAVALSLFLLSAPSWPGLPGSALAAPECIDADGEAAVVAGDIPSARTEAVARAKWAAVEQVVGVEVKSQSVVQNMALVDDAVSRQVRGFVSRHKVVREENLGDTLRVKVNACVEPAIARDAVSSLALNSSVAVLIPSRQPRVSPDRYKHDEHQETNLVSETVIGKLIDRGYTVVDAAPSGVADADAVERAIRTGSFTTLRSLVYRYLANLIVIGKVDYTVSTAKGENVGYGVRMPYNHVTVRLTWRLVTRGDRGAMVILAAGTEESRGTATSVEDATAKGQKILADAFAREIGEKISRHVKGLARKVRVRVEGVADLETNFQVKETLQQIAWVTAVEDRALGEFLVVYPENSVYLANSISQKPNLKLLNFSPDSIASRLAR